MTKPIVIIGAGIGGLSTAIRLAAAGQPVVVFEQNAEVGGKMGEIGEAGFRWDTGPSVITMRPVLEELFAAAGRRLADYLTLQPVEPLTRYFYPDGVILDASRDLSKMTAQIAQLDERDVEGYLAYLAYAARLHRITGPTFIYDRPPTWKSFTQVSPFDALKVDAWRKMDTAIRRYVRSPHLRQLLGRFATYVGASPYQAPATLNVIAHVELNGGVWYPQGGVFSIARALAGVAAELGVDIQPNCEVSKIVTGPKGVEAVILADGHTQPAAAVVANVDVTTVYGQLLRPEVGAGRLARLSRQETSCSGFILLLGVNKVHPDLAHHNIFFSGNYPGEFDQIFRQGVPPHEPTIYVAITAKADPEHAPPGMENWFVLVNAPPLGANFDWQSQAADRYRQQILARLAGFGFDVRPNIEVERMITPADLAARTGAWRGALYGLSSNTPLTAFRRPHNRAGDVPGLYFVGGTTHPGGGVPMVMLSGRVAAGMVLEDMK